MLFVFILVLSISPFLHLRWTITLVTNSSTDLIFSVTVIIFPPFGLRPRFFGTIGSTLSEVDFFLGIFCVNNIIQFI